LFSRPRRLHLSQSAACKCSTTTDERLLAYRDHRYAAESDRAGACLARAARAPRRQRHPPLDLEISRRVIRPPSRPRHPQRPIPFLLRPRKLLVAAARQRFAGCPFIRKPTVGGKGPRVRSFTTDDFRLSRGTRYEPPGRWCALYMQQTSGRRAADHPLQFSAAVQYAVEGRHQRRVRAVPGRCLRRRRCVFSAAVTSQRAKFTIIDDPRPRSTRRYEAYSGRQRHRRRRDRVHRLRRRQSLHLRRQHQH